MSHVKRIPDRRFRRRAAVAGVLAVVVFSGVVGALWQLTGVGTAAVSSAPGVFVGPSPAVPVAEAGSSALRARVEVALLGAGGVLGNATDKAPPEQLAQLRASIDAARVALAGTDGAAITAARDALAIAQAAVEASTAAWNTEQTRVAAEAEIQRQAEVSRAAEVEATKAAAAATKNAAAAAAAAAAKQAVAGNPKSTTAPAPVAVLAPPTAAPAPADPLTAGRDSAAWFTAHLQGIGATGFTISNDWAICSQPDAGPRYLQGCARSDQPTVIFMKPVEPSLASSEVGRGVVMHEWSHLLQYRLGYAAVIQASDAVYGAGVGLEQSADCMAIQLGAHGKPGGYTSDCSGSRGTLAAAFVAGRLA